ncbi:MAG: DUF2309 family protein [Bacteroidetes bacterium]|nr:DUF2309 family protein [Bacteroidota bacterium]
MHTENHLFSEDAALEHLRHYLPSQAPLKDFIHHNTLHAFQDKSFHQAMQEANTIFGYQTYMQLGEYQQAYARGAIKDEVLNRIIDQYRRPDESAATMREALLHSVPETDRSPRIGRLRSEWKHRYRVNLDKAIHPVLFRLACSFLDQGIAISPFPAAEQDFMRSLRALEAQSLLPLFRSKRAKELFFSDNLKMETLLELLVGDASLYERYLFDQQFAHPGWSGMIAVLEASPQALLQKRSIRLSDWINLELLLEIDALDRKFGVGTWQPLAGKAQAQKTPLFAPVEADPEFRLLQIWQEAYEWSYYDQVLRGLLETEPCKDPQPAARSFDAFFCIDDRECSLRRYVETLDSNCRTFGTPGFFNVPCYYQPEHGAHLTKICPAPMQPRYLIREYQTRSSKRTNDAHFTKRSHGLVFGWLISQTLGFWAALRLFLNIFKPGISPATSYSFSHMDKHAQLTIENRDPNDRIEGLQVGFNAQEMADCVEGLLRSTGLTEGFAPLVYMVGHGASSINNTHYAGYDCGACSGRPGSVNARAISYMANHIKVREILQERGIQIPASTIFIGALHDTTRDEIECYDVEAIPQEHKKLHEHNMQVLREALDLNAKERARRFILTDNSRPADEVHELVKLRSVSLFEPRPELNHATNTLCIVGRRNLTRQVFLDRRAFLNSYDPAKDSTGQYLQGIVGAAAPVCGGINLEYYFSRVDNYRLGAGTKLPHNVMGLIGVANGADGDLRTGLPAQMIEVHSPMRLMMIIEQSPELVLDVIRRNPATYNWFEQNWIHLVAIDTDRRQLWLFRDGAFHPYIPAITKLPHTADFRLLTDVSHEDIPVHLIQQSA